LEKEKNVIKEENIFLKEDLLKENQSHVSESESLNR